MLTLHPRSHFPNVTSDFDLSLPFEVRKYLGTYGLTPPTTESFKTQKERCMFNQLKQLCYATLQDTDETLLLRKGLKILDLKQTDLQKYRYLSNLRSTNVHLFYRLLADNIKVPRITRSTSKPPTMKTPTNPEKLQEITPLIYTPTVGEACLRWSEMYTQPEGLYLSYADKGHLHAVIDNWPRPVDITVVTDGSRILGLGDLGINGMGIPVGKLSLYTACAGIRPDATLPLTIDLGTNNEKYRNDPLYLGSRRERVTADEEREFMDEMMAALTEKWPGIVIQFEDFKNPFPSLERYQNTYTCFNDDIQGTGAVILGGFINAVKSTGIAPRDQRAVFLGAGSAGVGVAQMMVEFFIKEGGLSEDEAKRIFYLVDSKGLVTNDRGDKLPQHKIYFSRDDNEGKQYKSLHDVVEYVKPTILMGLSTIGGAFDEKILKRMGELNEKPVIFPLSNPSDNSECTFEDAMRATEGRCLFASGSPFQLMEFGGKTHTPGQGEFFLFASFPAVTRRDLCRRANVMCSVKRE